MFAAHCLLYSGSFSVDVIQTKRIMHQLTLIDLIVCIIFIDLSILIIIESIDMSS